MFHPEAAVSKTQEELCVLTEITRSNEDVPIVQSTDAARIPEEPMQPKTENENAFTKLQMARNDIASTENGNAERPATVGRNATDIELSDIDQVSSMIARDSCAAQKSTEKDAERKSKPREATDTEATQNNAQINKLPITSDSKASNEELLIEKLKQALKKTMEQRDSYKEKLDSAGKKLVILQESYDAIAKGDEDTLRRTVDQLRGKLIQTSLQLEDRNRLAANQEKQINALNSQVASLKEVESLTRSLLQIRNMEVKHLQAEVDDMEVRISEERDRYSSMINKMDAAVRLNSDLKKEYETQLSLFRDLREKYEEKVTLLSEEKRALENAAQSK